MTAIEQFYQFMYDHRDEAATELGISAWATLRPEHCVLFRPEDKPRLTNVKAHDMVLEDGVMQQIAEGSGLLAQPVQEGGLGDLQAFHIMMLLLRTRPSRQRGADDGLRPARTDAAQFRGWRS